MTAKGYLSRFPVFYLKRKIVNKVLLVTSVLMLLAHLSLSRTMLSAFYVGGSVTSIVNHGTTSQLAKTVDRFTMFVGFCIDMFLITHALSHGQGIAATLVCGAALCCWTNTLTHALAHFLVTLCHWRLHRQLMHTM